MKVQCPRCKKVLSVPDEYKGKRIKCKGCQQVLIAKPLEKQTVAPIVVPTEALQTAESPQPPAKPEPGPLPSRSTFLTKIWKRSPVAYRTGFLATLGVVSALVLCIYIYGRIFLPRPSFEPELTYSIYPGPSSVQGTGHLLFNLCKVLGELELAAHLRNFPPLSERTRDLLIARLSFNIEFQLKLNYLGRESKTFEKAIDLLERAIQAEIDILVYERDNPGKYENGAWVSNKDYMRLMDKAMNLRVDADWEIYRLMGKI